MYPFKKIEKRWQKKWSQNKFKIWHADDKKSKKFYILDMFPYPSGEGLHVGHPVGYIASDIYSRYQRATGLNVLHPMGWDAFGLPAEIYALKTGAPPQKAVKKNIARYRKQLEALALSYDWQREINTTDPNYYKWTQWIFLKLFEKGLAYEAQVPVNWCEHDKAVLANEEVSSGACERCGSLVVQKPMRQWLLKITDYAERLLDDLKKLDWPENVKEMQRNWIGRSIGAQIEFKVIGSAKLLKVFTTRPDTIFGVTFLVLSVNHPQISELVTSDNYLIVQKYLDVIAKRSEDEKEKTGVFTGSHAVNPMTLERIPIWISDYVLAEYGTGAIMAVPAHDIRDYEFAQKFRLPMRRVIRPYSASKPNKQELPYEGSGIMENSAEFSDLDSDDAKGKIIKMLEVNHNAQIEVHYRLRDWIFSRQRYWGEPIPIIKCPSCGNVPVSEKDLPVLLPKVSKYQPTNSGESPLALISSWVNTRCPRCGGRAKRETNTMPQWAGSSWYYIAYAAKSKSRSAISDIRLANKWLPVNIYVGGVEHATLHLLYARFWHKFLFDIGIVKTDEPFQRLINQGLVLGVDGEKMSKSRGNVISPDAIIKQYGADTLRMYEMFMAPLEMVKPWNTQGMIGIWRFLNRVWELRKKLPKSKKVLKAALNREQHEEFQKIHHQTIKKVTEDIQNFKYNTAISALMELEHAANAQAVLMPEELQDFMKLLFPFAPHIAQEMYTKFLKGRGLLDWQAWPKWNKKYIEALTFELVVQVNGKFRGRVIAPSNINEIDAKMIALKDDRVRKAIDGKEIEKVIFIVNRLINFIV